MRLLRTNTSEVTLLTVCDPYETLPEVVIIDGQAWVVSSAGRTGEAFHVRGPALGNNELWRTFEFHLPERTT